MSVILFSLYYCKLLLSVLVGFHQTTNPLNLIWRWNHWQYKNQKRNRS